MRTIDKAPNAGLRAVADLLRRSTIQDLLDAIAPDEAPRDHRTAPAANRYEAAIMGVLRAAKRPWVCTRWLHGRVGAGSSNGAFSVAIQQLESSGIVVRRGASRSTEYALAERVHTAPTGTKNVFGPTFGPTMRHLASRVLDWLETKSGSPWASPGDVRTALGLGEKNGTFQYAMQFLQRQGLVARRGVGRMTEYATSYRSDAVRNVHHLFDPIDALSRRRDAREQMLDELLQLPALSREAARRAGSPAGRPNHAPSPKTRHKAAEAPQSTCSMGAEEARDKIVKVLFRRATRRGMSRAWMRAGELRRAVGYYEVSDSTWQTAIRALEHKSVIVRQGERRQTEYRLSATSQAWKSDGRMSEEFGAR